MSFEDFEYEDWIRSKLRTKLTESKKLLKEALDFMNLVPNNLITVNGEVVDNDLDDNEETIDHYELCSRIDNFLKE